MSENILSLERFSIEKKIKSKKIIIILAIVIFGVGYYWFSKSSAKTGGIEYVTASAEKGMLSVSVSGSGQLEALSQVDLKPVVAGDAIDVVRVYVKNDQTVKKGDLIAVLDTKDAQKTVRNAELDLESAKNKYKQVKDSDSSTKYDKKAQELTVDQRENSLVDAQEKLSDYYIRAPFDGIVTNLSVDSGDSVSRSDILASIITKDIHAKVVLNEIDAAKVKIGNKAAVKFDALPELTISGKVSKIDTIGSVNQGVVSYNAEISFDTQNEILKPGMSASASVIIDVKQDVIKIPGSAVKNEGNLNYVEILNSENKPEQKIVQLGTSNGIETEIVSGINSGDKVVTQTINSDISTSSQTSGSSGLRIPGVSGGSGVRNFR